MEPYLNIEKVKSEFQMIKIKIEIKTSEIKIASSI